MFGLDIVHWILILLILVLAVAYYTERRKGEPIWESLRDKAGPVGQRLQAYGAGAFVSPFTALQTFNETSLTSLAHQASNHILDQDWWDREVATQIMLKCGRRILDNDGLRFQLQEALEGSGWCITPCERRRLLARPGTTITAKGEEAITDHRIRDRRDFQSSQITDQAVGQQIRQTTTAEQNLDVPGAEGMQRKMVAVEEDELKRLREQDTQRGP